jgi:hypothetical protein
MSLKEEEIRPRQVFDEYLKLAAEDVRRFFDGKERHDVACPACGGNGETSFVKLGFEYQECPACSTLFVSPRPSNEAFQQFYTKAESVKYWATTFYKVTEDARREKIWVPKAAMIYDILAKEDALDHAIYDIGGGYGVFAQEYERLYGVPVTVIEPGPLLAQVCRDKNIDVIQDFIENIPPKALGVGPKVFVSFELFEHLPEPDIFGSHLGRLMSKGDYFIFTTLSSLGIDIRLLWEQSDSVYPPHHLNFFNPHSVENFFLRHGLSVVRTATPGKLDLDILRRNQDKVTDNFWRIFLARADDHTCSIMQAAIATAGWSSHMMVLVTKQ